MAAIDSHQAKDRNADVLIAGVMLVFGFIGASLLVLFGYATKGMSTIVFVVSDLPGFFMATGIVVISALPYFMGPMPFGGPAWLRVGAIRPWHVALVVLIAMIASVGPVYHGFPFSMDEYMTRFQAEIFAAGRLSGEVPPAWRDVGRALHHNFAHFEAASGQVFSSYRPGMAILYALFDLAGLGLYASAIFSAGSVILVAAVARHLWPRSETAPLVAALLLATSQQVLITGLTSYAMPAHLFFNLLWLRLFLLDRPWAHVLAALVGVAITALHQVHPYIFFAAPFLLSLFRPFRPWLLVLYGTTCLQGLFLAISWDKIALGAAVFGAGHGVAAQTGPGFIERVIKIFRLPGSFEFSTIAALMVRFVAWQNLVLVPLLVIAARRAEWSKPMWLLAASVAFSLAPYLFLMPDQGHGWGYRYLHGLIGNVALLATAGWLAVEKLADRERRRTTAALLAFGVLSVVAMLPLRVEQVERMVAPFAHARQYLQTIAADAVVIDTPSIFYGQDLVRNRPFLENRPVLVDLRHLSPAGVRQLCAAHPGSVALIDANDLTRFGLLKVGKPILPPPDRQQMLDQLKASPCGVR